MNQGDSAVNIKKLVKLAKENNSVLARYSKRYNSKWCAAAEALDYRKFVWFLDFVAWALLGAACAIAASMNEVAMKDGPWVNLVVAVLGNVIPVLGAVGCHRLMWHCTRRGRHVLDFCEAITLLEEAVRVVPYGDLVPAFGHSGWKEADDKRLQECAEACLKCVAAGVQELQRFPWRGKEAAAEKAQFERKLELFRRLLPKLPPGHGNYFCPVQIATLP